jgi:hypothetical protein
MIATHAAGRDTEKKFSLGFPPCGMYGEPE